MIKQSDIEAIQDLEKTLKERGLWEGVVDGLDYRDGRVSGFFSSAATDAQKLAVANLLNGWDFSAAGRAATNKERAKTLLSTSDALPQLLKALANVVRKELNRISPAGAMTEAQFLLKIKNELGG